MFVRVLFRRIGGVGDADIDVFRFGHVCVGDDVAGGVHNDAGAAGGLLGEVARLAVRCGIDGCAGAHLNLHNGGAYGGGRVPRRRR